jgi:hypothetical protein
MSLYRFHVALAGGCRRASWVGKTSSKKEEGFWMRQMVNIRGCLLLLLTLSACSEGRWVHPIKTEVQGLQDWDICKAEVLAGTEFHKDTMAGGINLSGCMQSKGYRYLEPPPLHNPSADIPAPR